MVTGVQVVANYIPIANYRVWVTDHFVLPITDGVCVWLLTTLRNMESDLGAQSTFYQKV